MTDRHRNLILGGLTVGTLTCFGWLLACPHRADCLRTLTRLDVWAAAGTRVALPLLAASFAVWLLRVAWLIHRAAAGVDRLPRSQVMPPRLAAAAARTGAQRVVCLAGNSPTAFCAGAFRPRILVSEGVVRQLGEDELDAVLLHEQDHARRYEPLMRAAHDAAAQVFFYIPLLRWWARLQAENAELRADRAALKRLGPRPVAAALWALGEGASLQGAAAFAGVASLRVAQLLGDPLPSRAPAASLMVISAMGLYLAFQVASCLVLLALRVT